MRFLIDENVPRSLALALRERGYDAEDLPEQLRGAPDPDVLAHAAGTRRVLVTLDTDFGTLVFLTRRPPPPAVVLLRLQPAELADTLPEVVAGLEQVLGAEHIFAMSIRAASEFARCRVGSSTSSQPD